LKGLPLYRLLANLYRAGVFDNKVFVYAAGVITIRKGLSALQDEMAGYLALGYSVDENENRRRPAPDDCGALSPS